MQDLSKRFLCKECQDKFFWKKEVNACPVCKEDKPTSLNLCLNCLEVCGKLAIIIPVDLIQIQNCIACKRPIAHERV